MHMTYKLHNSRILDQYGTKITDIFFWHLFCGLFHLVILDRVFVREMLQDLNKKTSVSFVDLHFIQVKGDQRGYKDF